MRIRLSGIVAVITFGAWVSVHASIAIDPLRVEITAKPGETVTGFYTVTNTGPSPVRVSIETKDYYSLDVNKHISREQWLTLSSPEFFLNKNGSKQIPYTITVPPDASGFLMVINSFSPDAKVADASNGPAVKTVFSVPIYVTIEGSAVPGGDIDRISVSGTNDSITAAVAVKNTGTVYLRPAGTVNISRTKGFLWFSSSENVAVLEIPEGWPVFPLQTESYKTGKKGLDLKPGRYSAHVCMRNVSPPFNLEKTAFFTVTDKGAIIAR